MSEKITQVNVGGQRVGIIGLSEAIEETKSLHQPNDIEIKEFLLDKIKTQNYVPDARTDDYAQALLKEYKKSTGLAIDENEEKYTGLSIKILGPGCYACEQLEKDIKAILAEMNIAADVEHVREINQIADYGMVRTPGLVINGEVILSGRSLPRSQLKKLIQDKLK
jgi:small redox-active disulfide protein 2